MRRFWRWLHRHKLLKQRVHALEANLAALTLQVTLVEHDMRSHRHAAAMTRPEWKRRMS